MSSITVNQIRCYQDDPILDEVVRCSSLRTPELEFIPRRNITGRAYEFWRLTKRINTPIYVKECEGVCAEQAGWSKERRELAKMMRKLESCEGAISVNSDGTRQPLDVWDETRAEEMENVRRKMAKGMYTKQDEETSPYTLEDFAVINVDALSEEWNCEQDFSGAQLLAAGGLTTVYLVNASLGGLHWAFGEDSEFGFSNEEFIDIRDEEKSLSTGKNCTFPGVVQYLKSYHSIVAKCEFDVVAIRNVPCGKVDKFYLDNVLRRVTELVYDNTSISPNYAIMPTIAKSNWYANRLKQGIEAGGCCFSEVTGSSNFDRVPMIDDLGLSIMTTPNIDPQDAVEIGNVNAAKDIYNEVGELNI